MLQLIRDRAQGWFAVLIVLFICIPFAFWGINSYLDAAQTVVVAKVNGKELTLGEYQSYFQDFRNRLVASMGGQVDVNELDQGLVKTEALKAMLSDELLLDASTDFGLRVSDQQVFAVIQSQPAFQIEDKFSSELYESRLRQQGKSPGQFEEQLRRDMLAMQLRQGISDSAFATRGEIRRLNRLIVQKRDLHYLVIQADQYRAQQEVSQDEVQAYYDANSERFMQPEAVKIAYLDVSLDSLSSQVVVDEAQLQAYYERTKASYATPEERRASHLLVYVAADADAATAAQAQAKITALRDEAMGGKSMEEIANAHAKDEPFSVEGGEIGFFRRDEQDAAIEEAAFSLQVGETSEPVRSEYGFHVVKLLEVREQRSKTFAEAREEVAYAYKREEADKDFVEQLEELDGLIWEFSDTLEPAAEALGLDLKETTLFTRLEPPDFFGVPKVLEAAFSTDVVLEGKNSELVEVGDDRFVVLRALEHRAESKRAISEVRDEIVGLLKFEKGKQYALDYGHGLLERLRSGESAEQLAEAEKLQWEEAISVTRGNAEVDRAVMRHAFKMMRPEGGAPGYGGTPMGTGDYAIVKLLSVEDVGEEELFSPEDRERMHKQLTSFYTKKDWIDFTDGIKSDAKLETFPGNL